MVGRCGDDGDGTVEPLNPTPEWAWLETLVCLGRLENLEAPDEGLKKFEVPVEVEEPEPPEELGKRGDPEEELRKCEEVKLDPLEELEEVEVPEDVEGLEPPAGEIVKSGVPEEERREFEIPDVE